MLDHIRECPVTINIVQFGCGGTGSWLAHFIGKFMNTILSRINFDDISSDIRYVVIDDDVVEEHNIWRQNFFHINIGDYKCNAIFKFIMTPTIESRVTFITDKLHTPARIHKLFRDLSYNDQDVFIVLGCVDNVKTRRSIYSAMKKTIKEFDNTSIIYIDGGNDLEHGQVIITALTNSDWFRETIKNWHHIRRFPDIHKLFKKSDADDQHAQSCAMFGDQTMGINIKVAAEMFSVLQKILINSIIPLPLIRTITLN